MAVTNWREIKAARADLLHLKAVWDTVQLVQEIFSSYRQTLWTAVDVDKMMDEVNELPNEEASRDPRSHTPHPPHSRR